MIIKNSRVFYRNIWYYEFNSYNKIIEFNEAAQIIKSSSTFPHCITLCSKLPINIATLPELDTFKQAVVKLKSPGSVFTFNLFLTSTFQLINF